MANELKFYLILKLRENIAFFNLQKVSGVLKLDQDILTGYVSTLCRSTPSIQYLLVTKNFTE